jgi:hypothetical protein
MAARKRYKAKQVSVAAVRSMLASGEWDREPRPAHEIYRSADGRVLFVAGGSGTLFESAAEFEELYGRLTALPRAMSAIAGKWSSIAPDDIPRLVERTRAAARRTS